MSATTHVASLQSDPETEVLEALTDIERWLGVRKTLAPDDSNIPQVDRILRESSMQLATHHVTGHYEAQIWILERFMALRSGLESFGIETTELSTTINHRLKALINIKIVLQQFKSSLSSTNHPIPVNAIKIENKVYNGAVEEMEYCLGLNPHAFTYDLWKRGCGEIEYVAVGVAIPLQEMSNVYAPWPNALLFGIEFKNKKTVTVELGEKKDAESLIRHLKAVIMMEETFGAKRFSQRGYL